MFDLWQVLDDVHLNPKVRANRLSYAQWPGEGGVTVEYDGRRIRFGGCRRRAFYRYKNYRPDQWGVDFSSYWKMNAGNIIQDMIGNDFKASGIWMASELPVSLIRKGDFGVYRISGRIDEVIRNPGTGNIEIVEVKSTGVWGEAGKITPKPGKPFLPEVDHVLQVMPYLDWLRLPNQGPIKNPVCNILYFSREGGKAQHRVYFGNDDEIIIENSAGQHPWPHIRLPDLYADFDSKAAFFAANEVPERDFEMKWSRETVIWKKDHGELNKTQTKEVEKKLAAGETGDLIDKGDWQCAFCPYQLGCYGHRPEFGPMDDDIAGTFSKEGASSGDNLQQQTVHVPGK